MSGRTGATVLAHDRHDALEGVSRGEIAVQHCRQLAVRLADADLEPVVDHPRDFEAAQLTGDVVALAHDFEPDTLEQRTETASIRTARRRGDRFGLDCVEVGAVHPPDGRRLTEQRRPPGQHAGIVLGEDVQLVHLLLASPRHRLAESPGRILLGVDPASSAVRPSRTTGEWAGRPVAGIEVVAHQRGQLRLEQCPAPLGRQDG